MVSKITNQSIYLHNFEENEKTLKELDGKFITPYQFEIAKKIYKDFYDIDCDKKILSLIVAETQMGKTGIIQALTYEFVKNDNINPLNMFILTGLSSCEWVKQTKERFIDMIKPNIFHRNTIGKFAESLKTLNDMIIFLDEVHIATELKNEIGKTFLNCGLLSIKNLIERNIKIIQISATPDIALSELYKWDETNYNVSIIKSPDNYIGIKKLLDNNQIFHYKSLTDIKNVIEIKQTIQIKYGNNFKYHLLRVHTNTCETINNINKIFDDDNKFLVRNYFIDNEIDATEDLNDIYLDNKPNKHTIIIIKEKIRCSYTINKTYIGILYERKADTYQNETTIIQGFLGRACGYYDNSNRNIIIYTNLDIVATYILKIELEHEKELYKIKNNKKIINDKDINYNLKTHLTTDISNEKTKEYNIKVINDIPDIKKDLISGIDPRKSKKVYNDDILYIILKSKNYYDNYDNYKKNGVIHKLTYNSKMNGYTKLKEAIKNETYMDYTDLYAPKSSQIKSISESSKALIVIVNSAQNEIYLIHYNN
jgi:hypothetical protein